MLEKIGRYHVKAILGQGGMGIVYRAYDPQLERSVAVKLLQCDSTETQSSSRLLEEARSASALNHPNVCTIYEVGESGDSAYIAMEYVDGRPLDTLVRGGLPTQEAIEYGHQIADALAHAHEHGVIHGDLKCANVIISSDGRAKVVDFGLARRQVPDTQKTLSAAATSAIAGTAYAMAPEQLTGHPADEQSDVWAFGVVLFEMLTGSRPFSGRTTAELATAILRDPPAALPGHVPAGLDLIINRCLAKNVAHRYKRADEMRAALEPLRSRTPRGGLSLESADLPAEWSIPPQPALVTLRSGAIELVGRDSELAAIREAWNAVCNGSRRLVLLAGEPGIGKTRLVMEFARTKGPHDATVLLGRCDQEALVPYQPFVEALEWYVRNCPPPVLRAQAAEVEAISELSNLIPALGRRASVSAEIVASNAEGRRYRLFEAVASLLSVASRTRPVVLILEDIHWADRPTVLLLRHLLRSSYETPLLIMATYRENELGRTHPLSEVLSDLRREGSTTRLALRGLNPEQVGKFITASLGHEPSPALANVVVENTEGNPFFMGEVLRHLVEAGDAGVPESVREIIGRRLARLSDACNRIFGIAAVAGREFDFSVVHAVADATEDQLLDAVDAGLEAQLIQEVPAAPGRYSFTHALIRETLYSELTAARRIRIHRRIAEALEHVAPAGQKPLADLAYHFGHSASAGGAEKAATFAIQAAELATSRIALEEAARFYQMGLEALEFLPDDENRRTRSLDLHFRRGRAFADVGQWGPAKADLAAALALLKPEEQERRCEILIELAESCFWLLDAESVRAYANEALPLAQSLGRDDLWADALTWLGAVLGSEGDVPGAVETYLKATARIGGIRTFSLANLSLGSYWLGRTSDAVKQSQEAISNARASQDAAFHMYALEHLGLSLTGAGRYDEAKQAFDEMRDFGQRHGILTLLARGISMSTGICTALADFSGAEALAAEARDLAGRLNFMPPFVSAGIDLLLVYSRSHEPGRAEKLIDDVARAVANASGWHGWQWRMRLWQARAELAFERGDWRNALEAAEHSIEDGRARHRIKYETLGLMTRARARSKLADTHLAIEDAGQALILARKLADPAILVATLALQLELNGNNDLATEARRTVDQVLSHLTDEDLRRKFVESESVRLVKLYSR